MDCDPSFYAQFCADLLKSCKKSDISSAEVFLESQSILRIFVSPVSVICNSEFDHGAGLRLVHDGRTGFSFTNQLTKTGAARLRDEALSGLRYCSVSDANVLPRNTVKTVRDLELEDSRFAELEKDVLLAEAERVHKLMLAEPHITGSEGVYLDVTHGLKLMQQSGRDSVSFGYTQWGLQLDGVTQFGQNRFKRSVWYTGRTLAELMARTPTMMPHGLMTPGIIPAGISTLVLSPRAAAVLVECLFESLIGDAVAQQGSVFGASLFQRIGSEWVTLMDDGLISGAIGSRPFDDEGVEPVAKCIVEAGYLRTFIHDAQSAHAVGLVSGGNATRKYTHLPEVGPNNAFIVPGDTDPDAIVTDTEEGVYVDEVIEQAFDIGTGEMHMQVWARPIQAGRLASEFDQIDIVSTLPQVLQNIDAVANDLVYNQPFCSPTLRIRRIMIGS